jgi:IS30 family transposase
MWGRPSPCSRKGKRNNENYNMKTIIVSTEAKIRLQEAVRNYSQPASQKYRVLEEVRECIAELRTKKASYHTIRALLHDMAGIEVSHQTIARFCREVLAMKHVRKAAKKSGASTPAAKSAPEVQSAPAKSEAVSPTSAKPEADPPISSESSQYRTRGPRIAHIRMLDGTTT